jgi:hypothetical protein
MRQVVEPPEVQFVLEVILIPDHQFQRMT